MSLIRKHSAFTFIFGVAVILRLAPLFDYQFTYDELSALDRTHFDTLRELFSAGISVDAHPAMVQLLLYFITRVSYAEWMVKLPFVLAGIAAIVYAYAAGIRYSGKNGGLFAAIVTAFSLPFVYHAPLARPYAPGIMFAFALLYHFYPIAFSDGASRKSYVWFSVFAVLSAFNHHMGALFAATLATAGLMVTRGKARKLLWMACGITVLVYLPHLPVTLAQLQLGGIGAKQDGWLDKPLADALLQFIAVFFGTGYNFVFMAVICAVMFFTGVQKRVSRPAWTMLMVFVANYAVIHSYSLLKAPIFQNSVMMFSGAALLMFTATFLRSTNRVLTAFAMIFLSLALLLRTYFEKNYYANCVKTGFDYQFSRTAELQRNVHALLFGADRYMKRHYFEKYGTRFSCHTIEDTMMRSDRGIGSKGESALRLFGDFVSTLKADYVVVSQALPVYNEIVRKYYPVLVEQEENMTNHYRVYAKSATSEVRDVNQRVENPAELFKVADEKITTDNEFPMDVKSNYSDVIAKEGQVLLAEAIVEGIIDKPEKLELVISVTDASTGEMLAYSAQSAADFVQADSARILILAQMFMGTRHRDMKNGIITCYLWNRSRAQIVPVSITTTLIDYWPAKWGFFK